MPSSRRFSQEEAEDFEAQRAHEVRRAASAAEDVVRRLRDQQGERAPAFSHLSVRSCWSLRDGAIRPRELAAAAAAAGMTHVAVTDRDGVHGAVRFTRACEAEGVTPVLGTDLALAPDHDRPGWGTTRAGRRRWSTGERAARRDDDPRAHRPRAGAAWLEDDAARVTLLARTTDGWGDVCRTVTAAHGATPGAHPPGDRAAMVADRSSPHLGWDDVAIAAERAGTYALLGTDSPVGRLLAEGREDAAADELGRWLGVLGREAVLLGVRNHLVPPGGRGGRAPTRGPGAEPGDDVRAARTLALADRLGVRAVAVNDVRHLTRDDVFLADVLRCVRQQVPLGTRHLGRDTAEAWFTTAAEQAARFAERPDLLVAAHEVATSCEVDLGLGSLHVPRLTGMSEEVAAGELHRRCWQGVAERYDRLTPQVRERLERELAMVDRLGLHDYFLAVADVVRSIREMGVLAACRGSAAGSLVCYALRISDVDPVAHDLAFERFMNPYRDELPDIDVDVEAHRRPDVYELVLATYGEQRTSCVAMVETFQARMAVREVGKVLGLPPDELGFIAKSLTRARARDVRDHLRSMPELQGARLDAGQLERLFDVCERIDGFPRHLALHPCGILLADTRLTDRTPLERSAAGYPMSQFDKDDVAALGLLKLDVLAVRMLSAMRHAIDLLPHTRGRVLDVDDIPDGDPDTYRLIRSARSIGMFQIESPGQQELLGRLQPDHFGDLITEISLFRPGPVKADMVTPFVDRRHGTAQPAYPHPSLEPVLRETHGVIVYHEQVMGALSALTGCDMSYADLLRRQLSDPDRLPAIRAWALARAVERGFDVDDAAEVWRQVASFASFGFCKAHAAAFAVPTYRSAWMKAHVFPEFAAGLLTHDPGMYPKRLIVDEARTFGIAVLPPDVNRSDDHAGVEVVDQGLADHLLGIRGNRLPPGWSWPGTRSVVRLGRGLAALPVQSGAPPPGPRRGALPPRTPAKGPDQAEEVADEPLPSRSRDSGWGQPSRRSSRGADHPTPRPVGSRGEAPAGGSGDGVNREVRSGDHPAPTASATSATSRPVPPSGFDAGDAGGGYRFAVRLGLADVKGVTEAERARLQERRPFTSLQDLWLRAGLSRPSAEALVDVGALDQLAGVGRRDGPRDRRVLRLLVEERWVRSPARRRGVDADAARQLDLDLHVDHEPHLPPASDADLVRSELAASGVDVSRHVVSFYEPLLEELGVVRASELQGVRVQQQVRVAGVKVALQSPQQRSGNRVMFLSLDDRTGTTQATFFQQTLEDNAWTLLHAWLFVVEGRVGRRGDLGATVNGLRAWDLSRLWRAWQQGWLPDALAERGTPPPHDDRRVGGRPAGLVAAEFGRGAPR